MRKIITLAALLLFAAAASAQETKTEQRTFNTTREFKNKVFILQNRPPRALYTTLKLLGSGFQGADITFSDELHTLTVRDFPENLAAIEDAIKRLDVPAPATPDMDMRIWVLLASKAPLPSSAVPDDLAPVVKQLQTTLNYAHYGLLNTTVHRTKIGTGIEGSGVAESSLLGMKVDVTRPIFYNYKLRNISVAAGSESAKVDVEQFSFSMNVPLDMGTGGIQYQRVGFETPVSMRQKEKVVIGTTTMNDKALIVVVTATVN